MIPIELEALEAGEGSMFYRANPLARVTVAGTLAFVSGCALLTSANDYDVAGDGSPAPVDGGGGGDAETDASKPATIAPEDIDASKGPPPPTRPNAGVYTYASEGSDALKGVFPFKANYGPTATVKIEHLDDGCFNQIITLRDGYVETMHECIAGNELVQDGGSRAQKFPLVGTATSTLECKPGDAYFGTTRTVNQVWAHTCEGKNSDDKSGGSNFTTAGSYRYVGEESIDVKGVTIPVLHYRDDRQVTGKQTGANTADWFFAFDGVLVRLVRDVDITYPSIVGTVNYVEHVQMTLSALPQ